MPLRTSVFRLSHPCPTRAVTLFASSAVGSAAVVLHRAAAIAKTMRGGIGYCIGAISSCSFATIPGRTARSRMTRSAVSPAAVIRRRSSAAPVDECLLEGDDPSAAQHAVDLLRPSSRPAAHFAEKGMTELRDALGSDAQARRRPGSARRHRRLHARQHRAHALHMTVHDVAGQATRTVATVAPELQALPAHPRCRSASRQAAHRRGDRRQCPKRTSADDRLTPAGKKLTLTIATAGPS